MTGDLILQEDALSLTVPRQRRRRRRKIEIEAERAVKRRNLMEMVAQLRESHAAAESQSQAIDLTKVPTLSPLDFYRAAKLYLYIQSEGYELKTDLIRRSGYAPSPQGLSLIGQLPQCPGDKSLPQSPDGVAAASHALRTQIQWFTGG